MANNLEELVKRMNGLTGTERLEYSTVAREVTARDRQLDNRFCKDLQIAAIRQARNYLGDKLIRTVAPHRILDPSAGPFIAVRLNILTRKTLGGFETDLNGRVFTGAGESLPDSTQRERRRALAAGACTDTARSRAAFSAAAFFRAERPGEPPPGRLCDARGITPKTRNPVSVNGRAPKLRIVTIVGVMAIMIIVTRFLDGSGSDRTFDQKRCREARLLTTLDRSLCFDQSGTQDDQTQRTIHGLTVSGKCAGLQTGNTIDSWTEPNREFVLMSNARPIWSRCIIGAHLLRRRCLDHRACPVAFGLGSIRSVIRLGNQSLRADQTCP